MGFITNLLKEQRHTLFIRKLLPWFIYALLPLAFFRLYFHPIHLPLNSIHQTPQIVVSSSLSTPPFSSSPVLEEEVNAITETPCDYTDGKWVPDKLGPLYNGSTCGTIKAAQNCIAHGRTDLGYLYWRWKPHKCSLSRFDPNKFFHLMTNKHIAFIGDSMARNQVESLLCILSSVSKPHLVYRDGKDNKFRRWKFPSYNLTLSVYWSPFLVDGIEKSNAGPNHNKLFLHRVNEKWAVDLDDFHLIVFSIGHWYLHPAVYYEGDELVMGCHYCPGLNHTEIGFYDALRKALRTTFQTVIDRRNPANSDELNIFLATFSPSHFDGDWDKAGACPKTKPYEETEKKLEGMDAEIRGIEMEEVEEAKSRAKQNGGLRIEALDVTKISMLRPDGHPGPYMNPFPFANGVGDRIQNDCVHWCLPGPVDTWNEILLEIMNNWERQSSRNRGL
ncbi:protein ALTERED XYLOGLUCAN 4 [Cucumis sativus]|uniref:Uncharacterized protein n=1 Tax=Cucumis sativus TaxID=3659 RepID=A0A0A0KSE5_CUCSA|nr:protein ALTERED XYLOGLUCAN 4 [Cucumis sativus]KGN51829.1 hypothetical protein Csa_008663 [Cucumis sativus]